MMANSSTSSSPSTPGAKPPEQPELCGGTTGFVMMILMMIMIFIMFNPDLRESIALALDPAFNPLFGFEGKFPIITLLCTAIFLVICSTSIRHFMTDWVGLARAQKLMTAFNKERTNAMIAGNTLKIKKLEELGPEMQQKQMLLMTSNIKPMIFTMIFFIVVFPWIWMVYIENHLEFSYVSLPGTDKWDLTATMDWCIIPWGNWILIYILVSLPIGFLVQNTLKYMTFTRRIKKTEFKKQQQLEDSIKEIEEKLTSAEGHGIQITRSRELLSQAEQNLVDKKYSGTSNMISEAENYLERKTQTHNRLTRLISQAETMVKNAKKKGIGVAAANKSLRFARSALKRNDDTSAIYYAKQSQRQVKESRAQHKSAEDAISSVKALMYDVRDLKTSDADQIFDDAITAMDKKDYSMVIKQTKTAKVKAEEIRNLHKEAEGAIQASKNLLATIAHLELEVPKAKELFDKSNQALTESEYQEALDLAHQCNDLINAEKEKFQDAQESVSFAKLVIANALSFGASVPSAESQVADAEVALAEKDYERAIKLAISAKDIAEQAKRQAQRLSKRK